ncbi:TPA: hypothetical protein L8Q84_004845, partial [Klebsiella pneumoniae]|nr:hypothetical protein [Klebsiella pneumoniae]
GTSTALLGVMVTLITFLLTILQSKSDILEKIDNIFLPSSNGVVFLLTAPIFVAISAMMIVFMRKWLLAKQEYYNYTSARSAMRNEALKEKFKEMKSGYDPDKKNDNLPPHEN